MATKTAVTVINVPTKTPLFRQLKSYASLAEEVENSPEVKRVMAMLKKLDLAKAEIVKECQTLPEFMEAYEEEGIEVTVPSCVVKFTKGTTTKSLVMSPVDTIHSIGLENCIEAISVSASKIETIVGKLNADKYVQSKTGDRKLSSIKTL